MIDLAAYLGRIGLSEEKLGPDLASLEALHLAHLDAIPFENVDVRLRRPIRLDSESLHAKLVARRRGGYCFEHNTLFAAALSAIGFRVDTLEARVRPAEAKAPLPRTHMTLRVRLAKSDYLADVGFGASGPLLPVPLDGETSRQTSGDFAVQPERGDALVLRRRPGSGPWQDLYAFTLAPALPVDFEVASHYTSTYPSSAFVNTLTVQRNRPSARHVLRGRTYSVFADQEETVREISPDELPGLLRETFGLDLTDEEALEALGDL